MAIQRHTDKAYEADLRQVRERASEMGGKVEAAPAVSVRSRSERDAPLAQKVIGADREVIRLEIDHACRRILALRQPPASDLRFSSPPPSRSSPARCAWRTRR